MQIYSTIIVAICLIGTDVHGNFLQEDKDGKLVPSRRFLLNQNSSKVWTTLEQFAACSLTCVQGYEKLTEVCCSTGIDAVCLNLPWDVLKASLGQCSDNSSASISAVATQTAWVSLEQFAACSLTCVHGYEKLAEVCCLTGIKDVCSNLPWDLLKPFLKTCLLYNKTSNGPAASAVTTPMTPKSTLLLNTQSSLSTTESSTTATVTAPTTKAASPYWLSWGEWKCATQQGACFQRRFRNCSTGYDKDCTDRIGGVRYGIDVCTLKACPEYFTTTTSTPVITSPIGVCKDDPMAIGCNDYITLREVCREKQIAWRLCPASCNLCDTCWDYLNCSTSGAQKLFCGREEFALQYCRKTCGKCNHKPVDVQTNKCGDPVANELICELLQSETCICNDPDVRVLCEHYCDNKCKDHPFAGSTCTPARQKRRDETLQRLGVL